MKSNAVGLIGGMIAFVSLAFPWWTETTTQNLFSTPITISSSFEVYPYRVGTALYNYEIGQKLWFGWIALALILASGIFGLLGGLRQKRSILCVAGALSLSSVAVFVGGLVIELPTIPFIQENDPNSLFYFGTIGEHTYSMYLSLGFWFALSAGIVMLVASTLTSTATDTPLPPINRSQTPPFPERHFENHTLFSS